MKSLVKRSMTVVVMILTALGFAILDHARDLSMLLTLDRRHRSAEDIAIATGRSPDDIDRYLAQAAALGEVFDVVTIRNSHDQRRSITRR